MSSGGSAVCAGSSAKALGLGRELSLGPALQGDKPEGFIPLLFQNGFVFTLFAVPYSEKLFVCSSHVE